MRRRRGVGLPAAAGKQQREFKVPDSKGSILRTATFPGAVGNALLTFSVWGAELRAYNVNGKHLWSYPRATGIDDVWALDLNADGSDQHPMTEDDFEEFWAEGEPR